MLANIIGPDLLIVFGVIVLLFGGSQLPKLARSLGSARNEFERGVSGTDEQASDAKASDAKAPPSRSA